MSLCCAGTEGKGLLGLPFIDGGERLILRVILSQAHECVNLKDLCFLTSSSVVINTFPMAENFDST